MNLILALVEVLVEVCQWHCFAAGSALGWYIIIDVGGDVFADISLAIDGDGVVTGVQYSINDDVGQSKDGFTLALDEVIELDVSDRSFMVIMMVILRVLWQESETESILDMENCF